MIKNEKIGIKIRAHLHLSSYFCIFSSQSICTSVREIARVSIKADLAITDGGNVDYTELKYFDPILRLEEK